MMRKEVAYTNLADWFEYLNDDCDYENWSQYLIMKLKRYPVRTGLDVGCGGGWFTRAFTRYGYETTGMDVSPQMLDFAQRTALAQGVKGTYVLGDITTKKTGRKYDFVTAINDCINYIPKDKLSRAVRNVYNSLNKGGVFLFDISSPKKYREKLSGTVSADDREDVTYLAFNRVDGDVATIDVTLFVKRGDGAFERLDETHVQYVYEIEEIQSILQENGFSLQEVEGHLGQNMFESDRICFLAIKE